MEQWNYSFTTSDILNGISGLGTGALSIGLGYVAGKLADNLPFIDQESFVRTTSYGFNVFGALTIAVGLGSIVFGIAKKNKRRTQEVTQ